MSILKKKSTIPLALLLSIFFVVSCTKTQVVHTFDPKQGGSIVFIGNSFAEQLQQHNYFETLIYQSFPERNLSVRNLGWSGDEVDLQPRPLNFGTMDDYLKQEKADYIFAFFGLNESFRGPDNLESFKTKLYDFLQHLQQQSYNGEDSTEVILFSPIAHENKGGFMPDPEENNRNLKLYTEGMEEVAESLGIPFVDLYDPMRRLFADNKGGFTLNGIHLTEDGYREVGDMMAKALDLPVSTWSEDSWSRDLRNVIHEKNKSYFYRFRTQNGEYVFGGRKDWEGGRTLPSELGKIDSMVLRLDSLVWLASAKQTTAALAKIPEVVNTSEAGEENLVPPSTDQFILQEGYHIELFASEADFPIANPVSITFDPQGRLWVASMPSYPQYTPGLPPNDKLVILEDTDKNGIADSHSIFADSLYLPLGFELGDGGVYLSQAPDFVFLKDTDGDGKADLRKNLLHGFGTEDSHHAISAYTWGQDGALYMHEGTFLHSQVETPYGPVRGAYGTTWRYEPRTMKLESYVSYPYANPWGNVFMRDGTHIIGDVSTGMNYFATPLTVASEYPKKHVEMRDFITSKVKPKTCGHEIISSRQFPDEAQGNILFNTFVGFQGIKQHKLSKDGSGIIADEIEPLLQSTNPNFRPVDLKFGPDGALYVVDWYNPIIQHGEQGFREDDRDHSHGRIWKITYKGKDLLEPVDLTQLSVSELLDQLKVYEDRVRYRTRMQLREYSDEEVLPAVEKWITQLDPNDPEYEQHRLEGLWVYQQFHRPNEKILGALLNADKEEVRAAATRVLFYWKDHIKSTEDQLIVMSQDPSQRVRIEAIAALSHFNTEASVKALLAATDLPMDYYIDYALKEAFKHLQPVWMKLFEDNPDFLAEQPDKANFLLGPLSSPEQLALPGFLKGEPDWKKYERDMLSTEDYRRLEAAPAVMKFWIMQQDIPEDDRIEGVRLLAERSGKAPVEVILEALSILDKGNNPRGGAAQLSRLLVNQDLQDIRKKEALIKNLASQSAKPSTKAVYYALLADLHQNYKVIDSQPEDFQALVESAKWLRSEQAKVSLYPEIIKAFKGNLEGNYTLVQREELKTSAIAAMAFIPSKAEEAGPLLAPLIGSSEPSALQAAQTLLKLPLENLEAASLTRLKDNLVKIFSQLPIMERSSLDKNYLSLAAKVADLLPMNEGRKLAELVESSEVLVIKLSTLPGKMDFDLKNVAVPPGKIVEILFSNPDDMPHNILVLQPGSLDKVGEMADNMAQSPNGYERNFVPDSKLVLFATPLINSGQSFSLKFVSPSQEGDYPFACTFPGHWRTMNGIMKVAKE